RRRVDFDDIDRPAAAHLDAACTHAARLVSRALDAVQTTGHDPRGGRLAGATLSRKDVAVRDAILCNRVPQRGNDVLLIEQIIEGLRAVFAGDDLIHRRAVLTPGLG